MKVLATFTSWTVDKHKKGADIIIDMKAHSTGIIYKHIFKLAQDETILTPSEIKQHAFQIYLFQVFIQSFGAQMPDGLIEVDDILNPLLGQSAMVNIP